MYVERLLKAYIIPIQQQQVSTLQQAIQKINIGRSRQKLKLVKDIEHSSSGHNLAELLKLTNIIPLSDIDRELWGRIALWSTSWRYDRKAIETKSCQRFMNDIATAIFRLRTVLGE